MIKKNITLTYVPTMLLKMLKVKYPLKGEAFVTVLENAFFLDGGKDYTTCVDMYSGLRLF